MIETKEQYDHLWVQIAKANLDATAFGETIEALREVARLADEICNIGALVDEDEALDRELMLKLRALPEWLTNGSNGSP